MILLCVVMLCKQLALCHMYGVAGGGHIACGVPRVVLMCGVCAMSIGVAEHPCGWWWWWGDEWWGVGGGIIFGGSQCACRVVVV